MATETIGGTARPVQYDRARGWHRIDLDGIKPINPKGKRWPSNDAIERVTLVMSNPSKREQICRLMFEKTASGFRQGIGQPITGISAMLRDSNGQPTGIPLQLSKNWHGSSLDDDLAGVWFHGISQVRLPPGNTTELELVITYGHWGESICYDAAQVQAGSTITDVRPLMVRPMNQSRPTDSKNATDANKSWNWTSNVGGGDFFRLEDSSGNRLNHRGVRTTYHRQGPCLTEVTHSGRIASAIKHAATVSLGRTDDLVRGTYRIRMDVTQPIDFSRFVVFQVGSDAYNFSREREMAVGDETGVLRQWKTKWGGDVYRTKPIECVGQVSWASLHDADRIGKSHDGAWANRGIIIRSWDARLGGKMASAWMAERGVEGRWEKSSTLDIVPSPGVQRFIPGDYIEATIEHIIMPQFAADYYGPNEPFRTALAKDANTWHMIHREAVGNDRKVSVSVGKLDRRFPDICVSAKDDRATFQTTGGLGYTPITVTGLSSSGDFTLTVDGKPVDQTVHGNDFWQTDYDPVSRTWTRTYNVPLKDDRVHEIEFGPRINQHPVNRILTDSHSSLKHE